MTAEMNDGAAQLDTQGEAKPIRPEDLAVNGLLDIIKEAKKGGTKKVITVFLVHNISAWDALQNIYQSMTQSPDFLPIIVTIPLNFNHERGRIFDGEDRIHAALVKMSLPHVRFNFENHWAGLDILKSLQPQLLFRQSPWDPDIPEAYATHQLHFTKIVYTDYGLGVLRDTPDTIEIDYDQQLHRAAWMLLCANEDQKQIYEAKTSHKGLNAVVTGYPKFDVLLQRGRDYAHWPINGDTRRFRLIWAPHHSVLKNWLGFGTFHLIYKQMLAWVRETKSVEVVLKPHPMLFESSVHGLLTREEVDGFLSEWEGLENATIQTGGDYAPLLSGSDAMLTDGISFLAEYQLFQKPLLWLDSGHNIGFNGIGNRVISGAYRVQTLAEALDLLAMIQYEEFDPLKTQRVENIDYMMPFPEKSSDKVLNAIRKKLAR